jgi:hypothetical protein
MQRQQQQHDRTISSPTPSSFPTLVTTLQRAVWAMFRSWSAGWLLLALPMPCARVLWTKLLCASALRRGKVPECNCRLAANSITLTVRACVLARCHHTGASCSAWVDTCVLTRCHHTGVCGPRGLDGGCMSTISFSFSLRGAWVLVSTAT